MQWGALYVKYTGSDTVERDRAAGDTYRHNWSSNSINKRL